MKTNESQTQHLDFSRSLSVSGDYLFLSGGICFVHLCDPVILLQLGLPLVLPMSDSAAPREALSALYLFDLEKSRPALL